jgi:hypothetical protein
VVFAQTIIGVLIAVTGLVGTLMPPLVLPHVVMTVTLRLTDGLVPAVNVMLFVFVALVIVPPLMVQAYVAPATAGTLAVWPGELMQTVGRSVVICVLALIGTITFAFGPGAHADDRDTLSPTLPFAPAWYVIVPKPCPVMMLPLPTDQL